MSDSPFSINLNALKTRSKETSSDRLERVESLGEELGFISREASEGTKRGRKPSPRTGQIHAKVLPDVSAALAEEARARGVQQGVILEEALALYWSHQNKA